MLSGYNASLLCCFFACTLENPTLPGASTLPVNCYTDRMHPTTAASPHRGCFEGCAEPQYAIPTGVNCPLSQPPTGFHTATKGSALDMQSCLLVGQQDLHRPVHRGSLVCQVTAWCLCCFSRRLVVGYSPPPLLPPTPFGSLFSPSVLGAA